MSTAGRGGFAKRHNRLLASAMEQSDGAVMITDTHGRIEYVNPRYTEITGIRRDALLGTHSELVHSTTTLDKQHSTLRERISQGQLWSATMSSTRSWRSWPASTR